MAFEWWSIVLIDYAYRDVVFCVVCSLNCRFPVPGIVIVRERVASFFVPCVGVYFVERDAWLEDVDNGESRMFYTLAYKVCQVVGHSGESARYETGMHRDGSGDGVEWLGHSSEWLGFCDEAFFGSRACLSFGQSVNLVVMD